VHVQASGGIANRRATNPVAQILTKPHRKKASDRRASFAGVGDG
jgi:hypothetical protein